MLSKKRKPKYKKDKTGSFITNEKGEKIISNKAWVGKERRWKVNGQALYSGMNPHQRSFVIKSLKEYIKDKINGQNVKPIYDYPVGLFLDIYEIPGDYNWDIDNLWIWTKVIQDTLKDCKVIENDSIDFINDSGRMIFHPVENEKDRNLIINIFKIT